MKTVILAAALSLVATSAFATCKSDSADKKLAGAALDAHVQEPLPADSPLWDLPNVIVSPHNASASAGNEQRVAEMFIANFGHLVRGEPMFNIAVHE